jgi:hypothetical protein
MTDTIDDAFDFAELLEKVRKLPPMTPDEKFAQRLDFAYGNLACSTNHKPTREAFAELAKGYGWSFQRFAVWAEGKEWVE